jgi:hypothetical protein
MGVMDTIRQVLGLQAAADATSEADPEDLFGMSTAYITMGADLGYDGAGAAALCFSGVDSTDFRDAVEEVHAILERGRVETGTEAYLHEDSKGYEWVVLEDDDVEDLVTSIHFAADTLIERGYGSRLLAALFAFERAEDTLGDATEGYVYWVYSFRRGAYYPFAPLSGNERDKAAEFKLQSVLDGELDVEDDKEYWYPLWPDGTDEHPWS